jgi:MGT family glycosyltransferase
MAKVLVFNEPMYGHVHPTLAVVHELVARGEHVIYYNTDEFAQAIEATGAKFRRYEYSYMKVTGALPLPALFSLSISQMMAQLVEHGRQIIPQVIEDVRAAQPDYVIYDKVSLWGKLLALMLRVPAIVFYPGYVFTERLFPSLAPTAPLADEEEQQLQAAQAALEQLCSTYGIAQEGALVLRRFLVEAEPLSVVFIPRAFQPGGRSLGKQFVFVGPSIMPRTETTAFPWSRLHNVPTLYISLGTIFNDWPDFFRMCFEAFGNRPWQVVLANGRQMRAEDLGLVPSNFLVAPYVPQLEVLQHTDIFISHGGMNSTMESLYYGVPLVVIPQTFEQELTAKRVVELGLGVAIAKDAVSAATLQEAVQRITHDPQFHGRARQMQNIIAEAGGYQRAAQAILDFKMHVLHSV